MLLRAASLAGTPMLTITHSDNQQWLCRERVRQARANKLAHALEALEPSNKENDPRLEERALYCMLQPEEEALVDRLLAQVLLNTRKGTMPLQMSLQVSVRLGSLLGLPSQNNPAKTPDRD